MNEKHYIFGYGSLVSLSSLNRSLNREPDSKLNFQYCYLQKFERVWNLGMDNSLIIPNYKSYFEPKSLIRPDVFVTFLNVQTNPKSKIYGIVFEVSIDELSVFDLRERNYNRVDVTELLEYELDGIGWVYVGKEDSVLSLEQAVVNDRAVISTSYFNLVTAAYDSLGDGRLEEYHQSTVNGGLPLKHLRFARLDEHGQPKS